MSETLSIIMMNRVLLPGIGVRVPMQHMTHLDLIRDCQRNGINFGCCLQQQMLGEHLPLLPVSIGTEALVDDFGTMPDGTFYYRLVGGRRFRTQRNLFTHESVFTTEVEWFAPEPDCRLLAEHRLMGYALQTLSEPEPDLTQPLRAEFDHAASVCWRVINRIDMLQSTQQAFLEIVGPHERMIALRQWFAESNPKPSAGSEHEGSGHEGPGHGGPRHGGPRHGG